MSYVRRALASNHGLYAPTHIQLNAQMESGAPLFTLKTVKTNRPTGKGKQKEMQDEDFEKERAWLLKDAQVARGVPDPEEFLRDHTPENAEDSTTDLNVPLEEEGGLECGCCFSLAPFVCFCIDRAPDPQTNSSTAQYDSMSGRSLILHGMYDRLRFQPPRRAQL